MLANIVVELSSTTKSLESKCNKEQYLERVLGVNLETLFCASYFNIHQMRKNRLIEIKSAHHSNVWQEGGTDDFDTVIDFMDHNTKKAG